MYQCIFWPLIVAVMVAAQWWTFRGRSSSWFVPVEVVLGAMSALLWALLARSTPCNRTLFLWGLAWDLAYTGVAVAVPWLCFRVEVRLEAWFWIAVAVVGMVGAKWSMGE